MSAAENLQVRSPLSAPGAENLPGEKRDRPTINFPATSEMPSADLAEQALLGSVLIDDEQLPHLLTLHEDSFHNPRNRLIFRIVRYLSQKNLAIDLTNVMQTLMSYKKLEEAGGPVYLTMLADNVSTSVLAEHYSRIVAEHAALRMLIRRSNAITKAAFAHDLDEALKLANEPVSLDTSDVTFASEHQVGLNMIQQLKDQIAGRTRPGAATGFRTLDEAIGYLRKGSLNILAARPSMGKTAMAQNIVNNVVDAGERGLIFSLEMPKEALMMRYAAQMLGIRLDQLMNAPTPGDVKRIEAKVHELNHRKLTFVDRQDITVGQIRSIARQHQREHGELAVIMIDYIQLISSTSSGRDSNRNQEVSHISKELKNMARELDCPVIALSQLSRAVEQRPDKRPMLSDLRESGGLEQDADTVMFIYRDEYYNRQTDAPGVAEIIIGKQRNGPVGTVKLGFDGATTQFRDL